MSISTNNNISTQQISNPNPSSESHSDEFAASVFLIVQDALTSSQSKDLIEAKQATPSFSTIPNEGNPLDDQLQANQQAAADNLRKFEEKQAMEKLREESQGSNNDPNSIDPNSNPQNLLDAIVTIQQVGSLI